MLIDEGIITAEQLDLGLHEQKKTGEFICTILAKLKFAPAEQIFSVLSRIMDQLSARTSCSGLCGLSYVQRGAGYDGNFHRARIYVFQRYPGCLFGSFGWIAGIHSSAMELRTGSRLRQLGLSSRKQLT